MDKRKLAILAVIGALVFAFFHFDALNYLSFDYLKASQASLTQKVSDHLFLSMLVFVLIYVAVTALSLPGALILTLAGGALFGFLKGTFLVSIGSTCGATLAFLVSRFLFRDFVSAKFEKQLTKIHEGVEKEGAMYLLSMRLIPAIPFFVINLVMGLTKMRTLTYAFISQLGMLPGTAVYVNAGAQLATLESPKDILKPQMLIAFVLLGIMPPALKWVMKKFKTEK